MANYKPLGTKFDRTFRNDLNDNFSTLDGVAAGAKTDATKAAADSAAALTTANAAKIEATEAKTVANGVQTQLNNVIIESGTSDAEVIQARGTAPVLNERLNGLDSQLADKATKAEVQAVASGSPKGVYPTLTDLQTAFPSGDPNIYVVLADGKWYYWNGLGSWTAGGDYQATKVKDAVTTTNLIVNGNFDNTANWDAVSSANGTLSVLSNELIYTVAGLVSSSRLQQSVYTPVVGHVYYVRGDINPKYANTSYIAFGGPTVSILPTANVWNKISGVITASNTSQFKLYHPTNSGYVVGDTFKFRRMLVVDLTVLYGAGKEPSLAEFENTLTKFENSWFDGVAEIVPPVYLSEEAFKTKVDKVPGKDLSTNDYTDSDKAIVQSISNKTIITVKADGTGDFTDLRTALESIPIPLTNLNPYEVHIEERTYDVMTMYTQSEIDNTTFKGLTIPDYVSLVGLGKKENTIITMEIPDTWLSATILRVATIANMGNGNLENITVVGRNCRYTVHDDYAYANAKKLTKNCTFKKLAGLGNSQAWGEGTGSGMEFIFEDVEFITEYAQAPYSTHNNLNHTTPTYHKFKNCKFINNGGYFGIRFITLNSGQIEKVDMEGCYIDGIVKFEEYAQGDGCRYDFTMYGCTETPILIDATDGSQPVYTVNEETKLMKNAETTVITKGTPVKLNNDGSVIQRLGTNPTALLFGIAMQDIQPSETGMIKVKGYLPVVDTGLTLATGDLVGIVNGTLAKVTTGEYIGGVIRKDFVKLKF